MLIAFQDRFRIPKRTGAKQFSLAAIIPVCAIPFSIGLAAINLFVTIIMLLSNLTFLGYIYYYIDTRKIRTRFFFLWLLWSIIFMAILFQMTVPLLELLPEENLIFVVLTVCAIICIWRCHKSATLNHTTEGKVFVNSKIDELDDNDKSNTQEQTALLIESSEPKNQENHLGNACKNCQARSTTEHCEICSTCVQQRMHHSYWLDCCIGKWNKRYYYLGLMFSLLSLLLGCNLTLTAICHPVLISRVAGIAVMLPDDCSEVYEDYSLGIAFVISLYAALIAIFVIFQLIYLVVKSPFTKNYCQHFMFQQSPENRSLSSYIE